MLLENVDARYQKILFEDAIRLIRILEKEGFQARLAGGCVRDRILGVKPKDIDIATSALPETVTSLLTKLAFRVVPTGFDHGTVTVLTASGPIEVTTLRKDVKTDGRRAVVQFEGATFEDDAARRDFTINAMYEDADKQLYDYYKGVEDIKAKCLRFVGDAETRIKEDFLRILRLHRFWSRLGFKPTKEALAAVGSQVAGLSTLSQERITSELFQILDGPFVELSLAEMMHNQVLHAVLPEAKTLTREDLIMLGPGSNMLTSGPKILCRLIGLLDPFSEHWNSTTVHQVARRLRLSDKVTREIWALVDGWQKLPKLSRSTADALDFVDEMEHHCNEPGVLDAMIPIWRTWALHYRDELRADVAGWIISTEKTWHDRRLMPLPLNGKDLMKAFPSLNGALLGRALKELRHAFRDGKWIEADEGLRWLSNEWPTLGGLK